MIEITSLVCAVIGLGTGYLMGFFTGKNFSGVERIEVHKETAPTPSEEMKVIPMTPDRESKMSEDMENWG